MSLNYPLRLVEKSRAAQPGNRPPRPLPSTAARATQRDQTTGTGRLTIPKSTEGRSCVARQKMQTAPASAPGARFLQIYVEFLIAGLRLGWCWVVGSQAGMQRTRGMVGENGAIYPAMLHCLAQAAAQNPQLQQLLIDPHMRHLASQMTNQHVKQRPQVANYADGDVDGVVIHKRRSSQCIC